MDSRTVYALPITREQAGAVRAFAAELLGPRRAEFEQSWEEKGISRETAWLQPTSEGAMVLVCMEADDLARAFGELAVSDTPFDRWYRQRVLEIYGIDLTEAQPGNELVADWRAR
jgi:hypothetical protein